MPPSEPDQTQVLTDMYRGFLERPVHNRPASVVMYRLVDGQAEDDGADKHAFGTTTKLGTFEGSYYRKASFCALARIGRKVADC